MGNKQSQQSPMDLDQLDGEITMKNKKIDSKYLVSQSKRYGSRFDNEILQCILTNCPSLRIIIEVLKLYHIYIRNKQNINDNKLEEKDNNNNVYHCIYRKIGNNYSNTDLLNNFNHLLLNHAQQFEEMYDILIDKVYNNNKCCDISTCLLIRRNHRNRSIMTRNENISKQLYFNNDDIVEQELLDRIHCHFFHSFDTAHKITKKEKQGIITDDANTNDNNHGIDYDIHISRINGLVKSKRASYQNIEELNVDNNKFVTNDIPNEMDEFSYGFRYFYWSYYKNNKDTSDFAASYGNINKTQQQHKAKDANTGFTVNDFYINKKYSNFKEELILNAICCVGNLEWEILIEKVQIHIKTEQALSMKCRCDKEILNCYEMRFRQKVEIHHLIALMVYCNYDKLQRKFSETYRKMHRDESYKELIERHRNYYFLGRYLRECVECYGMNYHASPDNKSDEYMEIKLAEKELDSKLVLFHGTNKQFMYSSLNAYINGPFSTTTDYAVAVNFCNNKGMIIELHMKPWKWCYKSRNPISTDILNLACFDCQWISDFSNESEIFCIGGLYRFDFVSIIEAPLSKNYKKYIQGLRQITSNMTNGASISGMDINDKTWSLEEEVIQYRLLSHEVHRYYPDHIDGHEFKSCPAYFKKLLHSHCANIQHITFWKEDKVQDLFFKNKNNGWIKLDIITTVFPNIKYIAFFDVKSLINSISFFTESGIYEYVLSFIANNKKSKLEGITIPFHTTYKEKINKFVKQYQQRFSKHSWIIRFKTIDRALARKESASYWSHCLQTMSKSDREWMANLLKKKYGAAFDWKRTLSGSIPANCRQITVIEMKKWTSIISQPSYIRKDPYYAKTTTIRMGEGKQSMEQLMNINLNLAKYLKKKQKKINLVHESSYFERYCFFGLLLLIIVVLLVHYDIISTEKINVHVLVRYMYWLMCIYILVPKQSADILFAIVMSIMYYYYGQFIGDIIVHCFAEVWYLIVYYGQVICDIIIQYFTDFEFGHFEFGDFEDV